MRKLSSLVLLLTSAGSLSVLAAVGIGYSLFGSASYISPGNMSNRGVKLVADATANPPVYSGIDFAVPPI
jgi:hypothetical protein